MPNLSIKKIHPERWKEFKELRLEALKNDSIAFGSSYREEVKFKDKEWKTRIKKYIFADLDGKLIGLCGYYYLKHRKLSHIANIVGVYVKKEYRGKGISSLLLKETIRAIRKNKKIKKIELSVNAKQKPAIMLYSKFGFKKIGLLKKELKINNKYYDEFYMEKML